MDWIVAEDAAMKTYLSGIKVRADAAAPNDGREVKVWFRFPGSDVRERSYPFITIDLIDISAADEREQVGRIQLGKGVVSEYDPPETTYSSTLAPMVDYPMAVWLTYQVSVYSRSPLEDRLLQVEMWRKFPGKFGALYVANDETARTMQLVDSRKDDDMDENGKREFRKFYTVRVASEMWPKEIIEVSRVSDVNITYIDLSSA